MSNKALKLKDFIRINPDKTVMELNDDSKNRIIDAATSQGSKGLLITFDLSHSGRRINNRIYTPAGQRAGADTWTQPYPKPIITNHDTKSDPIGRFVSVEWQSLEQEAIDYLGNINDYMSLKRAYDSGKPSNIYKQMQRLGLLDKSDWPGLGKLVAKARITDKDAIQKFLDGRYLTFSAGSITNAMMCMVCDSAWHENDVCDHRPGMKDEDGNIGIFMTGIFGGREGSVVNMPADDLGFVNSMEFIDFEDNFQAKLDKAGTDNLRWMLADGEAIETNSVLSIGVDDKDSVEFSLEDLTVLEPETVAKQIFNGNITLSDALGASTHFETMWLIRIHDALHNEYDHRVAYAKEYDKQPLEGMPKDVFRLHGELHKVSSQKGFRDSLINGPLDGFDMKGSPSTEYMVKSPTGKDSISEEINQLKDVIMKLANDMKQEDQEETTEEVENSDAQATNEATAEDNENGETHVETGNDEQTQEDEEKQEDKEEEKEVLEDNQEDDIDLDADWYTMDLALDSIVEEMHGADAKLSKETREELPASAFCGPERSFPVSDCAHYTAALRLIGRYKGPGDKDKIRDCIERKGKKLGCGEDSECSCGNCRCKQYDELNADYVQALKTIDGLKTQLENVLDAHVKMHETSISDAENTNRLDSLLTWFDTIRKTEDKEQSTETKGLTVEDIKVVDNPGIASSEHQAASKSLGDFEQRLVERYKTLLDEQGQTKADEFWWLNRRFLPPNFDLSEHIN